MDDNFIKLATLASTTVIALATVIGNVMIYWKQIQTHDLVNSKTTQLLALTASSARAEGVLEGKEGTQPSTTH
jgi:hypothetical protein